MYQCYYDDFVWHSMCKENRTHGVKGLIAIHRIFAKTVDNSFFGRDNDLNTISY